MFRLYSRVARASYYNAKGLATMFSIDAVAGFFVQYINQVAFFVLYWNYHCVNVGCLMIFLVFFYFLFPETKSRPLEEVSKILDKRMT
ncbi:hypothetical protein C8Q69DRAFT_194480 [Paecilomyces variotii]|jgi:riboflavin transporter FmnP|uniref:Major facilitator superfamily (MFS) profile domain-containing protein n=1 Tax=Byssochlamys spectabilis TaxID=264951 RepID=A0A443HHB8_BYSSP|nr:hypothetical protein C8Q69DRAFT_194480 [Paecilomyces variotii]RWQ91215.1 hypothetical protein C8Q69DRAFT_194480 [Paecilomyces variotii]